MRVFAEVLDGGAQSGVARSASGTIALSRGISGLARIALGVDDRTRELGVVGHERGFRLSEPIAIQRSSTTHSFAWT